MFVQLAAMMFKRHFQEKPSTEQELFFFCWFLNKVGKPVDALELLDGMPSLPKFIDDFR